MPGVETSSAYVYICNTCLPTRTGFRHEHLQDGFPDVLALTMGSSPRNNFKRRSHVYDAVVHGNNGHDAGSPEGTTTLKEKSAVFRDGYRSRPVRAEKYGIGVV
jgi:hypothetical protein